MHAARVVGVCPFEIPDPQLAASLCRSGAHGVLDVGLDASAARRAMAAVGEQVRGGWGVRLPEGTSLGPSDLTAGVTMVNLGAGVPIAPIRSRRVMSQGAYHD